VVKWLLEEQGEYYPKGDAPDMWRKGFPGEDPDQKRRGLVLLVRW